MQPFTIVSFHKDPQITISPQEEVPVGIPFVPLFFKAKPRKADKHWIYRTFRGSVISR